MLELMYVYASECRNITDLSYLLSCSHSKSSRKSLLRKRKKKKKKRLESPQRRTKLPHRQTSTSFSCQVFQREKTALTTYFDFFHHYFTWFNFS
ncbi:hypothetical protein INR49_000199 [Caranx melampygus]|nr:hypothetical protein INR49_000199 [Caranx melampygus]